MVVVHGTERIFHVILFKSGNRWGTGLLHEGNGVIACLNIGGVASNKRYNAVTLPAGVKICPELSDGKLAPPHIRKAIEKVARRYGYEIDFDVF